MKTKLRKTKVKKYIKEDFPTALSISLLHAALIRADGTMGDCADEGALTLKGYQRTGADVYVVLHSREEDYLRDIGFLVNSVYNNCLKAHHKHVNNFFCIVRLEKVIRTVCIPVRSIIGFMERDNYEQFVKAWRVRDIRRSRGH